MRGYLVYVMIVKNLSHSFCLNSATVYQIGRSYRGIQGGFFETFFRGVCRPYHLQRLYSESSLFYLLQSGLWGYLVYCADCKILISPILYKFSHSILDWTASSCNFREFFLNILRGVCGPYQLLGLYSESALFFIYCSLASAASQGDYSIWSLI